MALALSKFFLSMSKYCMTHYHSMVKQQKRTREQRRAQIDNQGGLSVKDPKQPVTAYILYFRERVPECKEKHPACTYPELTCLIAQEWKDLPQSQKDPYVEKANEDRKRYKTEKKERRTRKSKPTAE